MMFARDGPSRIIGRKRTNPQSPLQSPLHSPSPAPSPLHVPSPGSSLAPSPHPPHHTLYSVKNEPLSPSLHEGGSLLLLSPSMSPAMSVTSEPPQSLYNSPSPHPYNSSNSNGFNGKRLRATSTNGYNGGSVSGGAAPCDQGGGGLPDWPMASPGGTGSMGSLSPTHHSMVLSPASTTSTGTCSPRPGE